jgi:ubiquinone/menaquinone biosynthesis C-methylase UbiE
MNPNHVSKDVDLQASYFELQASLGITNHMGGLKATKELAELCNIDKDASVLNVGCGVGAAACYIAQTYGCTVVGIDIREDMVARSKERAHKKGIKTCEFQVADAQNLPFEDNLFDAVTSESVTAFMGDKQKAVREYVRVTAPGGYVGLNETTWITPPPESLVTYLSRITGAHPESPDGWETLLKDSGLSNIVVDPRKTNSMNQFTDEISMIGLTETFKPWARLFSSFMTSSEFRKVTKEMTKEALKIPKNLFDYFGYGFYVGKK